MPTLPAQTPPGRPGARRLPRGCAAVVSMVLLLACGDGGSGPDLPVAASLQPVQGNAQSGVVGETLPQAVVVKVTDSKGRTLSGVTVNWSVESGGGSIDATSVSSVAGLAAANWTLGTVAGNAAVRASSGNISATFTATATPGPTAAVSLSPATFTLDPGAQRQLTLAVTDAFGNALAGRTATWQTTEPLIATVDGSGTVRGVAGGTASIRATVDGRVATSTVTVTGTPAPIPSISAIAPAVLTPGVAATITGNNFSTTPAANVVTVNGAAATVTSASATELRVTVPAADRLGCLPTSLVDVVVTLGSARATRPHPLQTGTRRTLALGQALYGAAGSGLGCSELAAGSGRYIVSVYNVGNPFSGSSQSYVSGGPGIQVRTATAAPAGNVAAAASLPEPSLGGAPLALAGPKLDRLARHLRVHEQVLEENTDVMRRVRLPRRDAFAGRAALVSAVPAVGDSLWIRFPDVSKPANQACSQFDSVRARVVQVGTRAIVLEDIAAPLAGQIDSLYQRMGTQFDQVQYPVIRDNFGDPLALDAQLNNDGHLYMLFTRRVNGLFEGNILGFVWSGDFDDGTFCKQSNRAEIFYGFVPTVLSGGASTDWDVTDWYNYSRSTMVHELKHVASMATRRLASDQRFAADSMWLEEAGAMVAEELWARQIFGYQQRGNTGFDQSIRCELNLAGSGCTGMPAVMINHFAFLYDYYERADSLTFLGRAADGDATFYGSAWAFLRWLTDHSGMAESQFLTSLTQASTAGITSIQNLTGRSYEDLFREYVLAMAVDDRAGFTPANARLTQPSWNTRDIFSGMNRLFSGGTQIWPLAFPIVPRTLAPPGNSVAQVRPGGAVWYEFEVPAAAAQAFEVLASSGGILPADLRVAIIRVQ